MSYYSRHVFFCTNKRNNGKKCCQDANAEELRIYTKKRLKKLGLKSKGASRINASGCLGRCDEGPIIVVYPEGTWYTYENKQDIDEIINSHIIDGQEVKRLLLT